MYLYYNSTTGAVCGGTGYGVPRNDFGITHIPDHADSFLWFDDDEEIWNNSSRYLIVDGAPVLQPYITLAYANGAVTAQLNNPPATPPASVTFTIAGTAFSLPLTNGAASLTVAVHKVVAPQAQNVAVSADGFVGASLNIGGTAPTSSTVMAAQQPDGSILVKETSKALITAYYMAHDVPQSSILTDIANWVDLLTSMTLKLAGAAPSGTFLCRRGLRDRACERTL